MNHDMHLGTHFVTSGEKHLVDILSILAMVGALTDYLPHVAALFTIFWTGIRIWETDTIKYLTGRQQSSDNKKE